ncbi:MAG: protein kinase [Candidatus Obscuribacterales bacterium]|nr:protein kinase [Candidatus Obscuribacterales bacterium]
MKLCLVCNFQFGDDQDLCPKDLSKLVPVGKDPLIGMLIQDRYRVESLVAKGSMGVIYKATQEAIGRVVAIKVMHGYLVNDDESMKRYHKEAKAASRLNHPNITTVYDFGVLASGQPYIVMDLLQGKALADVLAQRGQLTVGQTLMVMNQVCLALGEAHARGVVHRDIKPENIVIEELPDGKNIQVKVVDFGIATFAQEGEDTIGKITKTGTVCGSPFYMSPEQCDAGKTDARSDLYSLGIVLFECLTGKVPFESKDIYLVLSMQVKDPPPRMGKLRPDLEFSAEMEKFVAKALAKDKDARFQSAQEFWEALAAAGGLKPGKKTGTEIGKQTANSTIVSPPSSRAQDEAVDPEELRKKIREATELMQEKAERAQAEQARKRRRSRGVTPLDRLIAMAQIILPPILTLAMTVALFWVIANQAMIHSIISKKTEQAGSSESGSKSNVETLMAQDKLEEAKAILEQKKKDGSFSSNDQENFDWVCVKLARKESKAKHFKQAMAILDQVSSETREEDEVKALIKKIKKQLK